MLQWMSIHAKGSSRRTVDHLFMTAIEVLYVPNIPGNVRKGPAPVKENEQWGLVIQQ